MADAGSTFSIHSRRSYKAAARPMQGHRLREEEPAQTREERWKILYIITFSIHQCAIHGCGIEGRGQVVSRLDYKWP